MFNDLPTGRQAVVGVDYDPNFNGVDFATEVLETVEYGHAEVHAGKSFHCSEVVSLNDTTQQWLIITKNLA